MSTLINAVIYFDNNMGGCWEIKKISFIRQTNSILCVPIVQGQKILAGMSKGTKSFYLPQENGWVGKGLGGMLAS